MPQLLEVSAIARNRHSPKYKTRTRARSLTKVPITSRSSLTTPSLYILVGKILNCFEQKEPKQAIVVHTGVVKGAQKGNFSCTHVWGAIGYIFYVLRLDYTISYHTILLFTLYTIYYYTKLYRSSQQRLSSRPRSAAGALPASGNTRGWKPARIPLNGTVRFFFKGV